MILNTQQLSYLGSNTPSNFCINLDFPICPFSFPLDLEFLHKNYYIPDEEKLEKIP